MIMIIIIIIIQLFIIYVPSQQLQGQLQTQHSVDTSDYIENKHNIKSKTNYRQALEEDNTLILVQKSKQTNKQR
jgi:thioredoxin-related protein